MKPWAVSYVGQDSGGLYAGVVQKDCMVMVMVIVMATAMTYYVIHHISGLMAEKCKKLQWWS